MFAEKHSLSLLVLSSEVFIKYIHYLLTFYDMFGTVPSLRCQTAFNLFPSIPFMKVFAFYALGYQRQKIAEKFSKEMI